MKDHETRIERLKFTTDEGVGERARIGLLVLESDQTMEDEFRRLVNLPGVSVYHSRLACDVTVTPDTLAKMAQELPKAARLLPDYMGLKAIGYGCTSASTIIGEGRVAEIIAESHPNIPSSNPLTAAKVALKTLGVKKLGLVTPYRPDVTEAMQDKFTEVGIAVNFVGSFYEQSDFVVGRMDEESILQAAISVGEHVDVDGVFISCTSLRAANIIEEAERILGKPVTASNHALAWHLLRLSGIDDVLSGHGRLYKKQLVESQ